MTNAECEYNVSMCLIVEAYPRRGPRDEDVSGVTTDLRLLKIPAVKPR